MKVIGFTNKFYTLWEVTEDTRDLGNGHKYIVTHFSYIKNISFDKNEAIKQYPDAKLDESLRGQTRSFDREKEVWETVNVFRFGKYKYQEIGVSDLSYLEWYWDQIYDEDHKNYVSSYLKSLGYEIRTWGDNHQYLMSPEALKNEAIEKETMKNIENSLSKGNPIEFIPEYNLDEDGEYRDGDVIYKFPEVKENYYRGFTYFLPVQNGKAKRFKNKNIVITNYTYETGNTIIVNVIDFEIKK